MHRLDQRIVLSERGLEVRQAVASERPALCVFEHIYFSRPDSKLEGRTLQSVRGHRRASG